MLELISGAHVCSVGTNPVVAQNLVDLKAALTKLCFGLWHFALHDLLS
jgi:hypothetical protein